ncbi:MAG: ABC transporter permease [Oscillospiraceae bacterium]|nr:ABC transporter permease [Oscillospiraceae bacterium]
MTGLYMRLAAVGVRKNGKSYVPYILTAAVMVSVLYIVTFLSNDRLMDRMIGGNTMKSILSVGIVVMTVFSAIFLFYTNSFLIKRRKKEFGLYNILGLKKSQIARVLVWETLMVYALSMIGGLGLGILFSKLAEQLATKMLRGNINYTFSVNIGAVIITLIVFAVIFFVILMNSLRQLFFSRPIELLRSGSTGEKPPKTNVPFAVLGLLLLGTAYYMAVTIENPGAAIIAFMIAVIMVILATYLLFIAGSVVMCAVLRKNKRYYYKTEHFVSVSQMAYRMRKNGAGLASICILATMVLVTISSTATLYFGVRDYVEKNHPYDIGVYANIVDMKYADMPEKAIRSVCAERSIKPEIVWDEYMGCLSGKVIRDALGAGSRDVYIKTWIYAADVFPEEPVKDLELADGVLAYYEPFSSYMDGRDTLNFYDVASYSLKRIDTDLEVAGQDISYQYSVDTPDPVIILFVKDREEVFKLCAGLLDYNSWGDMQRGIGFNVPEGVSDDEINSIQSAILQAIREPIESGEVAESYYTFTSTKVEQLANTYGVYGGLFFLGILLGGVFLLAAVLIMYYKQITEGFEDAARFEILHKVGMSRREIKKTINSQVLTVFFLPLIAAGVHMTFAFPIVSRLLYALQMDNTWLFALVTLGCYLLFAAVYILVYKLTSGSYSKIVNK